MKALNNKEIRHRLIRLRNLERLHKVQGQRLAGVLEENKLLKERMAILESENSELKQAVIDLKLQLEELRIMVFGKKRERPEKDDLPPSSKMERTADSYKRPVPPEEEVTERKDHPIDTCVHCHQQLSKKKTFVFFEEDIPIPTKRIVRKHSLEYGYCDTCREWSSSVPFPGGEVVLGNNIQKYICYLSVCCRLSYSQIQSLLLDSYNISVSQGEMSKILERRALELRPEYAELKQRIRGEYAIGLDETGWKILCGGGKAFAWVMTGLESGESVFLLGESRGKGNVETLRGEYNGVTVSDDYNAYHKLPNHQLCWAHLLRKFRDLANSDELNEEQRRYCWKKYQILAAIHADLKERKNSDYRERLIELSLTRPHDPQKLVRIKTTLRQNMPNYLTCLKDVKIPLTNNQAERSLRHPVLKRKISFGSWSKRTADNFAILLSVLMSRKQRNPQGWLNEWVGA